jgi:hypothetical protein
MDHNVADVSDAAAVLARLDPATPTVLEIARFWRRKDPTSRGFTEEQPWRLYMEHLEETAPCWGYEAPGGIWLDLYRPLAHIHTTCRWRGFLSLEPHHSLHVSAFNKIAGAVGATRLVYFPDDDHVMDLIYDGGTFDDCLAHLRLKRGPPEESVERIREEVQLDCDGTRPNLCWEVWYLESAPQMTPPRA